MPRIIVVDDQRQPIMDEHVIPEHLNDEHSSVQLLERLAWAIEDAHRRTGDRPRRKRRRNLSVRARSYTDVPRG